MPAEVFSDARVFQDGRDLSGVLNAVTLAISAPAKDATVLGDTSVRRLAGIPDTTLGMEGYFDPTNADDDLFTKIGLADVPVTIAPGAGAAGARAFFFRAAAGEYAPEGEFGEVFKFSFSAAASSGDKIVRGTLLENATKTATANGAAFQVGAVSATQKLYAALHVLAAGGTAPTLDVTVESDDASGFASPTTRLTFAQKTAVGSQWITPLAGAITDDFWRVAFTIGGTAPTFTFALVLGIQ